MGSGFARKKKQAREIQQQLMQAQEKLQTSTFVGTAGNGLVSVTLNGDCELKKINISKECVDPDDVEGLELLITAAFNDAAKQARSSVEGMGSLGNIPGFGSLGMEF
jgi:DNA-binding YbaB/EbfC family protein